jgi:hypothetical protein
MVEGITTNKYPNVYISLPCKQTSSELNSTFLFP